MSLPRPTLALLCLAGLLTAGCLGLPPGSADNGDSVTVRYSAVDADTGASLRTERTATFVLGSGASGLGLAFERAIRGQLPNATTTFTIRNDPSTAFHGVVEVSRQLPDIPVHQDAPRADFDASQFGPAVVGKTFPAYGIYQGTVTAVGETTVTFDVSATDGQRNAFPAIGAVLVSTVSGDAIRRVLDPDIGAQFTIQPPSAFQPTTPLGLEAGTYRVLGATATHLQFTHSTSLQGDLIGKGVTYTVTVVRVSPVAQAPAGDDYGVRNSPQVNGDPFALLQPQSAEAAGHVH